MFAVSTAAQAPVDLQVRADIDGSDTLVLEARGAEWRHRYWSLPTEVSWNGVPWPLDRSGTLAKVAGAFVPAGVDFGSAMVRVIRARDTVVAETRGDRLLVHFADNDLVV